MKSALLEIQMAVPSLKANASLTINLKDENAVIMGVEAALNLPETTSTQKVTLKYGKTVKNWKLSKCMCIYISY